MGVEFFPCDQCGDPVCDAGNYAHCDEEYFGCGRRFHERCGDIRESSYRGDREAYDALSEEEQQEERTTCIECRGEHASDANVLAYLLGRFGLTREQADKDYLESEKGK